MHILFLTTVDASFSALFTTWLALLLNSVMSPTRYDATDVQYSIAVGCMPSANRLNDGRQADKKVSLLSAGINCTYINDVPGFENEGVEHLKKYFVSYPNVRRMMVMRGFASTGLYDMIVYSDLDAFSIRSPVPDLLSYYEQNYSAVFTRGNYNTSNICNGYYALMNMSLPQLWMSRSIYSQNEMNAWSTAGTVSTNEFRTEYHINRTDGGQYRVGLLPEPDYFRGACGTMMTSTRKVEHCSSSFFSGQQKMSTFHKLNRLIASEQSSERDRVSGILAAAIEPSGSGMEVSDFDYKKRDQKISRKPQYKNYKMVLYAHRLNLTSSEAMLERIHRLPRWRDIAKSYQLNEMRQITLSNVNY